MSAPWDEAPVGLLAVETSGVIRAANSTISAWTGISREELLTDRRLTELLAVAARMYWETHLSPLLLTGEEVSEVALELLTPRGRLPVLLNARPTPDGLVLVAVVGAGERADDERRLRDAWRATQAANTALTGLHQVTASLSAAVGSAAVRAAAVTSAVESLGARSAELWSSRKGRLVMTASAGDGAGGAPPPTSVPPASAAVADGDHLLVPLRGQSTTHGVLRLTHHRDPGSDTVDIELATAMGRQTALALDRAESFERTASIAHELQRSLLAAPVPRDPRFTVATVYRPGVEALDVGGDWYDVFLDDAGRLSFVVGDVVGRGLGAAAAMGQLRSAVRAIAGGDVTPAALLSRLDRFVDQLPPAEMATVAYGILDLDSGDLQHAGAGHLPPVLMPARGPAHLLWGGRGMPLSGFLGGARSDDALRLSPGDRLVLCTDGLVERRDRSLQEGLDALLAGTESLRDAPVDVAADELARILLLDEVVRDDVCVLVLEWSGPVRS